MEMRAEFPCSPTSIPPRFEQSRHYSSTYIFMLNRLNLLTRHLSRPFSPSRPISPSFSAPSLAARSGLSAMTSAVHPKLIHTAACLIIGDEVLGGKVV